MPGVKAFKKTSFEDRAVSKLQENVDEAFKPFIDNPLLNGTLLKDVFLATGGANIISHRLGRKPLGYIITSRNANSTVWDAPSALPTSTLELHCSGDVTVSLWVF